MPGLGVVALVDVPFLVLQPTHNKQDFADSKEYRHLLKVLGSYMDHYWEEAQKAELKNVSDFWEKYGYNATKSILTPPSTEMKFMRQRAMVVKTTIQVRHHNHFPYFRGITALFSIIRSLLTDCFLPCYSSVTSA